MSDPVTNAEIEDVLSAVRRLVSETGTAKRAETPSSPDKTKLVLTPAFRVEPEPEPVEKAEAPTEPTPDTPTEAEAQVRGADVADGEAEVEAAVEDTVVEAAETPEDAAEPVSDDAGDTSVEALVHDTVQSPEVEAETPTTGETTAEPEAPAPEANAPEPGSLAARIAELEAVVIAAPDTSYEPDGSEQPDVPDEIIFHHAGARIAEVKDTAPEASEPAEPEGADDTPEEAQDAPVSEPETLRVETADDDWQDVSDATDDVYAQEFESASETLVEDATFTRHDTGEEAFAGAAYADDADEEEDDELVIDEAMLREIVARLVREELQGKMGQHITRNLRRMVRREIARALALQSFE